ncbi:MAG: hypothetical protein ACREO3_05340, partial [Arenimonas sp.]
MLRFIVLVALYLTGVRLADSFIHAPGQVALFWPAAGIAFALVLRYGWRWSGVVAVAVLIAHFPFGRYVPMLAENWALSPVPGAFIPFSIAANTIGALVGAWYAGNQNYASSLSLRTGLRQLRGAVVGAAVSGVIGAAGLD